MSNLTHYEPFGELLSMRKEMDRLFEEFFNRPLRASESWGQPLVDMYQTEDDVVIKATLPGVKADDLDIQIADGSVNIRAEIQETREEGEEGTRYHIREQHYRTFARSIALPTQVNPDKVEAELVDGILTVNLPKAEEVKPKMIAVKAK